MVFFLILLCICVAKKAKMLVKVESTLETYSCSLRVAVHKNLFTYAPSHLALCFIATF